MILEPRHAAPLPQPATTPYIDKLARNFIPSVLFVRTGQRAQFLNSDEELHNINVKNGKTREPALNVALPPGISYAHTFEHSGVYDVSCDAHPGMSAQIIAASSPYVAPRRYQWSVRNSARRARHVRRHRVRGDEPIEKIVEVTGSRTEVNVTRR